MPSFKFRRPSPAMVIACIAMFAAIGGTAVAGSAVKTAKTALNAKKVDGLSASKKPKAGQLLALDKHKKFPKSVGAIGPTGPAGPMGDSPTKTFKTTLAHAGDTAVVATYGPFSIVAKCTGTDSAPSADFFIRTSMDNSAFTDYNNSYLTDFDVSSGDREIEYGSSSADPNSPDMNGPYDGTFAATSADLNTYITGSLTTGTYIGGPSNPPCFFAGAIFKL